MWLGWWLASSCIHWEFLAGLPEGLWVRAFQEYVVDGCFYCDVVLFADGAWWILLFTIFKCFWTSVITIPEDTGCGIFGKQHSLCLVDICLITLSADDVIILGLNLKASYSFVYFECMKEGLRLFWKGMPRSLKFFTMSKPIVSYWFFMHWKVSLLKRYYLCFGEVES